MSTIRLIVEPFNGSTVSAAARDLCALADRVGILCEAKFNDVLLWAYPGDDPGRLVDAYMYEIGRPHNQCKIAVDQMSKRGEND